MKKILSFLNILLLLFLFNSCEKVKGKGDVVSEFRTITGFTAVSLDMEGELVFTPDSIYSVEIKAQQNIIDVIETQVDGGRLVLKLKSKTILGKHDPIQFNIHAPSVNNLNISGSGDISTHSLMAQPELSYNISGSGNISLYDINSHNINGSISGSGNITASSGTTSSESLTISGSGSLDFLNVIADTAFVTISGSGNIKVHVVKYMDVTISGSGNVKYDGTPVINLHNSGSGSVTHI